MLQFLIDVLKSLARINRELYKSESSKDDCCAVIPLKLLCTKSELVKSTCENVLPLKLVNCMLELSKLQSLKREKSSIVMRILQNSECIEENVQLRISQP